MEGGNQSAARAGVVHRWMYSERFGDFVRRSSDEILGELLRRAGGNVELTQSNAWQEQIAILKSLTLADAARDTAKVYFEYTIPRLGRRADVVLIVDQVLFVVEFKVGETQFLPADLDQVWDYALDLKHFHEASHDLCIAPVLIATKAGPQPV